MSKHTSTVARRKRLRLLFLVGTVIAALGISSPALAVIGIVLPIPSAGNPTTAITVHVNDTSTGTDLTTPSQLLDLSAVNPSLAGVLGLTNVPGGLTQTSTTISQLLAGLKGAAAVATPVVSATATAAVGTAITNLASRAQQIITDTSNLDLSGDQAQLLGAVTDLEGQATSTIAGLLPLALTSGLQVAQNVISPVCSLTAVPSSFVPGIGVDTTRLYTAAAPVIQQVDQNTNQLLRDTYTNVYNDTLASVNNIPNIGPIASALLLLLKYNWTSTYTPPGSTTPIVTTTPALMDVPTPIDVDHDGIFDLCGTTSFALTGSGTSISGIKITQTITKMPLAKPVLPVEISGGLLNVLNFGYDTTESTVPIVYTSAATLDSATGGRLNVDDTYAVHRGTNLVIPPFSLNALNLPAGVLLPTFPPLLTPAPKPIVTQETCIGACSGSSAIAIKDRFENVPTTTHVDAPLASAGVNVNYSAPSDADSYTHTFSLGSSITLSTGAGRDQVAPEVTTPTSTSAPQSFTSCLSVSDGSCSPNAASTDKGSIGFTSSEPTLVDDNVAIGGAAVNTCTGVASLAETAHVLGSKFFESFTPSGTGVGSGRFALDSANQPANGCIGAGSVLALTGSPNVTMPTGFVANNRVSTYHNTSTFGILTGTPIDSKTGTITCPAGTAAGYTSLSPIGTFNLQPVICSVPPIVSKPTISGQALVDATLTGTPGAGQPPAPNAPTYSNKIWSKCDASGANCVAIPGATGDTYTLQYGSYPNEPTDFGHRFTFTETASNLDGSVASTSDPTAVVALPPPPTIASPPVLGSNRHVGDPLTTTNGTYNNGATTFAYHWQRCNAAGDTSTCADIPGAPNAASYVVQTADKGMTLRVGVIGSNHGGSAPINYSATVFIPPSPVNTVLPGIKNGPANAIGAPVATGDNLSASSGSWNFTTSPFTFQWQRCDASGNNCADISGATGALYNVQHPSDDGSTLRVVVTGHGLNGDTPQASGTTGVVSFNDLSAKPVTQIPDGTVNATVAGAGTTTYVGGSFDTVGAPTGGSGLVPDTGTGSSVSLASATAGAANGGVTATVPDGAGGYFLGGSFTQVKGVQCPSLAHLLSDGSVDQNYCYSGLTGSVNALTRMTGAVSKVLVVGGSFTLGGHKNLMFIDPASPATPVFDAVGDPNGAVNALTVNGNSNAVVYIGGKFSQAGNTSAGLLAAESLTWTSGQLTSVARNNWVAGVCIGTPSGTSACTNPAASVNTMTWVGIGSSGLVILGGRFDTNYRVTTGAPTNTATRNNALMIGDNGTSPGLAGWNPNIGGGNQTVNAIVGGPTNSISNIPVYIGGDFTTINNVAIKNLGEFGTTVLLGSAGSGTNNNSGPMTSWVPNPNGPVTSLAWAGTNAAATMVVGGAFTKINTGPTGSPTTLVRHRLAMITLGGSTGATLPVVNATWDPNAGRTVRTVSRDTAHGTVTVGGDFVVLGGTTRNNLAEFDPNSGMTGWNPSADGTVNALAFRSGTVYAGGTFANAGGAARASLAALDGATGAATSWNPGTSGTVNALATDATNVYVGGLFGTAGGQSRTNLAAIDGTGAATGWNPGVDGAVRALTVSGGNVYVGGTFANAGGAPRANAAAIDGTGAATGFAPNPDGAVNAVFVDGSGAYLGGAFANAGGAARANIARVDPGTGVADASWNPGTDGVVNAVFVFGSNVFAGGSFANAGGAARSNLAAIGTGTGTALSFHPDPNGVVNALSRTSGGSIAVGGAFAIIAGQAAPALGFFGG